MLFFMSTVGCQSQLRYPTRDAATVLTGPDAGFGSLTATIRAEDCPDLVVLASPAQARVGETIALSAHSSDPALLSGFSFAWSASGGDLDDATLAAPTFRCPGRESPGPEIIQVTAGDGRCQYTRQLAVSCLALADGGGPTTMVKVDAGAMCTVEADPTTCEGDACNQCTLNNCDTLARVNSEDGSPNAGCDLYRDDDDRKLCQRAYACIRDFGCMRNSDPRLCWCGTVDPEACDRGDIPGNGPCRQQVFDAAKSDDPAVYNDRLTDPTYPIGGAINLATCRSRFCSLLGDEPSNACRF